MNKPPSRSEIGDGSLDCEWAAKFLLGRTADEIQELFEDNLFHWGEAFMWIGPVACAYYGRAAIAAAWKCAKGGDGGATLNDLVVLLQHRFDDGWDVGDQPEFTSEVIAFCERVEREHDSLGHDSLGVNSWDMELFYKVRKLHEQLRELAPIASGLPTEAEMNVGDTANERQAMRAFRGRNHEGVREDFIRNSWHVAQHLTYLGPTAFAYYLPAAIAGAGSPSAKGNHDGTPSSRLFLPLRRRATERWNPEQVLPLKLDAGMMERLPEILELLEFLEQEPAVEVPRRYDDQGLIRTFGTDDYREFRWALERVRDELPRPALLANGTLRDCDVLGMYDGMVFIPEVAYSQREEFLRWYSEVTDWKPRESYDDPTVCDPRLRAWLNELITEVELNGNSKTKAENGVTPSFCCGASFIYFTTSSFGPEDGLVETLAAKHGLGVFWVSRALGEVLVPDDAGELSIAHQRK